MTLESLAPNGINPPSTPYGLLTTAALHNATSMMHHVRAPSDKFCHLVRLNVLPFPCIPENNTRMKAWLIDRYSASTCNTSPHRALLCIEGPPVEIHVEPTATPKACHTSTNVPLHWQQRVYGDLLRDEALGVIERVPYGEPVTWYHRMIITRKHDGSPCRTVDLSPLNKFCRRETFTMETSFHLARRIPKDTRKTVTDAWNGYHSVPLRQSDCHLTILITPFGRWRYTRVGQIGRHPDTTTIG